MYLNLPVRDSHIMPSFNNSLIAISRLCDENCTVLFTKHTVNVFDPEGKTILTGWRDQSVPHMWRLSLLPTDNTPPTPPNAQSAKETALSTYYLPSVEALIRFYHDASGFPTKSTWIQSIKYFSYSNWHGLTTTNATKYFPDSIETSKVHMTQMRQVICSTKPKCDLVSAPDTTATESLTQVASK